MLLSVLICFYGKKISVSEFLRSARSSFLLFPIKKENRQRLYNLLSIFILKLIVSNGNTSSQTQTQAASNQNAEQMSIYQPVFDANYYYTNNLDLQSTIGLDAQKLFEHFYTCGMAEGRKASENFDVSVYKANNPDLAAVFGDDLKAYYTHYVQSGRLENRVCK